MTFGVTLVGSDLRNNRELKMDTFSSHLNLRERKESSKMKAWGKTDYYGRCLDEANECGCSLYFFSSLNTAGKMEVLLWLNDIASEQAIRIH